MRTKEGDALITMRICVPLIRRWQALTVTIGDQSYSGATFITSTVTDATNAEQLVITLADDVVAVLQIKVYVTYSGSDLDDAAGNQVTQFTKLVDVSGSSTANAATDGITSTSLDSTGKIITIAFDEDLNVNRSCGFRLYCCYWK